MLLKLVGRLVSVKIDICKKKMGRGCVIFFWGGGGGGGEGVGGGGDGRGLREKKKDFRGGKWEGEWGGEIKRRGGGVGEGSGEGEGRKGKGKEILMCRGWRTF